MSNSQEPGSAFPMQDLAFYYNRGNEKFTRNDYLGAIADYTQALCSDPHDWEAWMNLGNAYDALGDYAKSLTLYDRALTLNPESSALHYNRGNALMQLGHLQQARDAYNRAIESSPDSAWAYGNRGHVLSRLGLHVEAICDYGQAFRLAPDDPNAGWIFTWAHLQSVLVGQEGRERQTVEELQRIAQIAPEQYIASLCLGVTAVLQDDLHEALVHFERASQRNPQEWDPAFWIGLTALLHGQLEIGRQAIDLALEQGLPPVLLTPLRWVQHANPGFFTSYASPLLEKYGISKG